MQLVFLWMDADRGLIRDLNLQFSPQHPCVYDMTTSVLKRERAKSDHIFSEYAPPVTNVSVLVGENGSGKTSIMREIYELLRRKSKTCQFLALYYGKGSKDKLNHEGYYWWSNIKSEGDGRSGRPFTTEGFENDKFIELDNEDVEDEFFIVRYTDVLSLSEYAKRDSIHTDNSCDLTMSYRILKELEYKRRAVDRSNYDAMLQLYHTETEWQIRALDLKIPVSVKSLEIIPCVKIDVNELKNQTRNQTMKWEEFDVTNSHSIKGKARKLCERVVLTINSWEDLSRTDVLIKSIVYTYLRHVIVRYDLYGEEEMGTGVPAAIKREVNAPLIYWRDNLALKPKYKNLDEIENMLKKSFESVGVPFAPNTFISNLMCFIEWIMNSGDVDYDKNVDKFLVDVEKVHSDKLLEAFQSYKNSIGQYGEAFAFELNMSSGERAFSNLFAYMYYARSKMEKADNPQIIRENSKPTKPNRTVILLFDELDAFLHPRWQQIEMETVLDNVSKIFKGHDVQIIFSTHSPLLLSDIPLTHTIFLQKENGKTEVVDKKYQTFADNIYRLYEDSFFMNPVNKADSDDVWIRGSFANKIVKKAENIMNGVHKRLKSKRIYKNCSYYMGYMDKMKRAKQIIELIGEPFLQRMMLGRWNDINAVLQNKKSERK